MFRKYLTSEFENSAPGVFDSTTEDQVTAFDHDILLEASDSKLDVFIMSKSLADKKRYGTFAKLLRDILQRGGNVSIFIWNECSHDLLPSEMKTLFSDAKTGLFSGKLTISVSDTKENSNKMTESLIAKNKDGSKWLCRIGDSNNAVICNDPAKAQAWSGGLLSFFKSLQEHVPVYSRSDFNL